MPVFDPPTVSDMAAVLPTTRGVQRRLFRYYGDNPRGLSVVTVAGHYTTIDTPSIDQLVAAGRDGFEYFLGGHTYDITDAVSAALVADGYVVFGDGLMTEAADDLITEAADDLMMET